jgi:SulP family sulfate permease
MADAALPKSLIVLKRYTTRALTADLIAGITVGLVALPLAMAFAISSGVKPEAGLYCAIVAGFLISALGGSRFQIGGPTGAFVVVVASIVARYGLDGLFMCTMMAGGILIVLGATGYGLGREVHSQAGRGGIHQRYRRADREHADQGFPWPADRRPE